MLLVLSALLFSYTASSLLYSFVFWISLTVPAAIALAVLRSALQLDVEVMKVLYYKAGVNDVSHRTSLC